MNINSSSFSTCAKPKRYLYQAMRTKDITPVTMERLVRHYQLPHIANEVVFVETLKKLPEMTEARRLSLCMFMGVCTDGVVSFTVNEKKRIASRNNVMVITDESVVDSINFSPDFDGIGFFISYKLLQEILKDIQNMSDLFLLTHNHPVFEITPEELSTLKIYLSQMHNRIVSTEHRYRLEVVRLLILTMIFDTPEHALGILPCGLRLQRLPHGRTDGRNFLRGNLGQLLPCSAAGRLFLGV